MQLLLTTFTALLILFFHPSVCANIKIKELTLEEKVGQVLMPHFQGKVVNKEVESLIQDLHLGAVILYAWANDLSSAKQVRSLSQQLQALAKSKKNAIPLFIAVDQEGGVVQRCRGEGFTSFPGQACLGQLAENGLAFEVAMATGYELKAAGINMNLSPVVDVLDEQGQGALKTRSFGSSPLTVSDLAGSTLEGYRASQCIAVLKHFPGLGRLAEDSHQTQPLLTLEKDAIREVELIPYAQLAPQADAVMTAHVMVPSIDSKQCATLSKKHVNLLRAELGFKGVLISDSLCMKGVLSEKETIEDIALRSFEAGCDLLCLGGRTLLESGQQELQPADIRRVHAVLVQAVRSGRISEERLNTSVQRLLQLKQKSGLYRTLPPALTQEQLAHHTLLAQTVALEAVEVSKNQLSYKENPSTKPLKLYIPKKFYSSLGLENENAQLHSKSVHVQSWEKY